MYATRDGKPIDDLQASDVELLEDGVPQTIGTFEHVTVGAPGSSSRARVFVVFLDTYNTQIEGSSSMRLPLIKVLDRVIAADDMVAVMTPGDVAQRDDLRPQDNRHLQHHAERVGLGTAGPH